MTERVLFFSPHAGIWVHAFPEALVADAVRRAGADVTWITCDGGFRDYCVVMGARNLREDAPVADKRAACAACSINRDMMRRNFGFAGYDFDSVLTPEDDARVDEVVAQARPDDVASFVVDGIRAGQLALYEYLIAHKRVGGALDAAAWAAFRPRLANVVRSLLAAQRIVARERPTRLVMYNTLYSVNAVWRAVGDRRGIPVYVLHAGPNLDHRLQTLLVARDSTTRTAYRHVAAWPEHAGLPANSTEIATVTDHFVEVLRGCNVFAYSSARTGADWRTRFGIRRDQRILVATLSSYDEYVAARAVGEQPDESSLLFATQIEWIRALVEWIRERPDRFLLIRVHPRELPNKRERLRSQHARQLEAALVDLPANVRVNWPDDGISLYDVAEHASVILNAWSSAGKEMALLGRPVVGYCPSLLMYAPAINEIGETRQTYFAAVEAALAEPWSFERIRKAYRWCAVEYVRSIAGIGDAFHVSERRATTFAGRARNALLALPRVRQAHDLLRRPRELAEGARIASVILDGRSSLLEMPALREPAREADETAVIRHELARIYAALYGEARDAPEPGSLRAYLYDVSR
jgi:hypothetical protein